MAGEVWVELCHISHLPGAEGQIGERIQIASSLAERWCADGSAKPCDGPAEKMSFDNVPREKREKKTTDVNEVRKAKEKAEEPKSVKAKKVDKTEES